MDIHAWLGEFHEAFEAAGEKFSQEDEAFLRQLVPPRRSRAQVKLGRRAREMMTAYFFRKATDGELFGRPGRVDAYLKGTVEERYDIAPGPFAKIARCYWSFKLELDDLFPASGGRVIAQVLFVIHEDIGGNFRLSPKLGPPVSMAQSAQAQRLLLESYAPLLPADHVLEEAATIAGPPGSRAQGQTWVAIGVGLAGLVAAGWALAAYF